MPRLRPANPMSCARSPTRAVQPRGRSATAWPSTGVDAVLSSPLLRARETAEAIARAAGLVAEPDERLAPGADADAVREAVAGRGDTVVMVGHQPDCSEIVLALTGERVSFEPGAVHEVEL